MSKCWSECFPSESKRREVRSESVLAFPNFFMQPSSSIRTLTAIELLLQKNLSLWAHLKYKGSIRWIILVVVWNRYSHASCVKTYRWLGWISYSLPLLHPHPSFSSPHLSLSPFLFFFSYFPLFPQKKVFEEYVWSLLSFFFYSWLVFGFCVSFAKIHCYIMRHPHTSIEWNTCTWQRQITRDFRHTCHFLLSSYSSSLISLPSLCEKVSLSPSLSLPHDSFVIVLFDQCLCLSIIDQKSTSSFPCNLFHPLTPQVNKLREINVFSDFSGSRNESSSAWLSAIYIRDST